MGMENSVVDDDPQQLAAISADLGYRHPGEYQWQWNEESP